MSRIFIVCNAIGQITPKKKNDEHIKSTKSRNFFWGVLVDILLQGEMQKMKKNLAFLLVPQASKNCVGKRGIEGKAKSPHQKLGSSHAKMLTLGASPSQPAKLACMAASELISLHLLLSIPLRYLVITFWGYLGYLVMVFFEWTGLHKITI